MEEIIVAVDRVKNPGIAEDLEKFLKSKSLPFAVAPSSVRIANLAHSTSHTVPNTAASGAEPNDIGNFVPDIAATKTIIADDGEPDENRY